MSYELSYGSYYSIKLLCVLRPHIATEYGQVNEVKNKLTFNGFEDLCKFVVKDKVGGLRGLWLRVLECLDKVL